LFHGVSGNVTLNLSQSMEVVEADADDMVDVLFPIWILRKSHEPGLPQSQKQAMVLARLKKPTMDPADLNSY
jgi:hypothetical protein